MKQKEEPKVGRRNHYQERLPERDDTELTQFDSPERNAQRRILCAKAQWHKKMW